MQQLAGASSPGLLDCNPDAPLCGVNVAAGDAVPVKDTLIHSSTSIRSSRLTGVGMGKPVFIDDDTGKKGGSGRQRVSVGHLCESGRAFSRVNKVRIVWQYSLAASN